MRARLMAALLLVAVDGRARAQDVDVDLHGYLEGSLARTPADLGSSDGGTSKLRWGGTDARVQPAFGGGLLEASAALPFGLSALADLAFDPQQKSALDLIDASLAWRPPAAGDWRWSTKLGAFFPPFGLENRDIGWTSPWTLTPSALGAWVGQELRTIGGEASLGRRLGDSEVTATLALFGWNDVAGAALATRGWDLGRTPTGLFDQVRLPNAPGPTYAPEFKQIDATPGWYAGLAWDNPAVGRIQLMHYDNEADPRSEHDDAYAWRTRFWDLGYTGGIGPFYVIAEGITGDTQVAPDGAGPFVTDFETAYLLAGWTIEDWRAALRVEQFTLHGYAAEHGRSATAALNYEPEDWLRLTAEVVVVDATSRTRAAAGLSPRTVETQPQLGLRLSF